MQLRNRTISTAQFDQLHVGMQRLAKVWNWRILDDVSPDDPSVITLRDLGLDQRLEPLPELPAPDEEPTLEQWIAAGYTAESYELRWRPGDDVLDAALPDVKA